jgi:hypothetical protein
LTGPIPLSDNSGADVSNCNHTSHDAVRNLAPFRIIGQSKTEAPIDDPKGDDNPTEPDMTMRPGSASADLLELTVVHKPKDRLEKQQG